MDQIYCPGCGVHKTMCGDDTDIVVSADGSWECRTCLKREATKAKYANVKFTIIPCPACVMSGLTASCLVCNKLGSVKVPDSEIRILSTALLPQLLTETATLTEG